MTGAGRGWRLGGLIGAAMIFYVASAGGEPHVVDVQLRERMLPPPQRVLVVQQGDDVTLRWSSNHPMRVRLQGYNLDASIAPGTTTMTTFRALTAGRFKITTRDGVAPGETTLGYLEVRPR